MKSIFTTIVAISLAWTSANATNYYLSNTGNDSNIGTSPSSPWLTITQLNTVIYSPGDSVFFNSGDIFRGEIQVSQGGNSSLNVVFTSYGSGNLPIISGAEPLSLWSLIGISYQASFPTTPTSFFVNNKEKTIARYPNDHQYLTNDSTTNNYIKDNSLTTISSALIIGSKVCSHTAQWCWEKSPISAFSGDQLTYSVPTVIGGLPLYGYFLYDNILHLDTINEWKYDAVGQTIYYIPPAGEDPNLNNCEASIYTNGIKINLASYISISNLSFEKQTNAGVLIFNSNSKHIKIDGCRFEGQYNHGVNDKGKYNEISNNYFRGVDGIAVFVNGTGDNSTIHHNTFRNIGQFRNNGIGTEINLSAIKCAFVDSCYIHHNDIDSTGYCGISADGGYHLIERNIVKNAMLLNNDGAALKSYGMSSHDITFRNNFVSSSDGNTEGTNNGSFVTPAIYFDFNVNNCTIQENTVYGRTKKGIFLNSGNANDKIIGNVIYGGSPCIDFNGSPAQPTIMTGMLVKYNSFFVKDPTAYIVRMVDNTGGYNQGTIDSNYYFQPYSITKYAFEPPATYYSFTNWQSTTGFDLNTKNSFVSWTLPTSDDSLFMNPTDNVVTISLGTTEFLDLDSNIVCDSITLQPYTSIILINTYNTCVTGIDEINTEKKILVFPNPFSNQTTIQISGVFENATLTIYNTVGQQVKQINNIYGNTINLHRDNLPIGLYLIHLTQDNKTIKTGKLIITD